MGVKHRGEGFGPGNRYGDCRNQDCDCKPKSGLEDDPAYIKPCLNLEHDPPTLLYIEPGKQYRHVCKGCGKVTILRPPNIHW